MLEINKIVRSLGHGHYYMVSSHRLPKEGTCPYCVPEDAQTNEVFRKYRKHRDCLAQNILVCKSCAVEYIQEPFMHTYDSGFDIWCLGYGLINNTVRLLSWSQTAPTALPPHASCHGSLSILAS